MGYILEVEQTEFPHELDVGRRKKGAKHDSKVSGLSN